MIALLLALQLAFALLIQPASGGIATAVDGDTIRVEGVGTVRLIGIDSPETVHPFRPVEPFGPEASWLMHSLVDGKSVTLQYEGRRTAAWNRVRAYVVLPDGRVVNEVMVQQGLARVDRDYPFSQILRYLQWEGQAQQRRVGMWERLMR